MPTPCFSDRSLLVALAVNTLLAGSAGALVGGLTGAQLGLAGGLVVLMAIMVGLFGVGILSIVRAVRAETAEANARKEGRSP